MLSFALVLVKA